MHSLKPQSREDCPCIPTFDASFLLDGGEKE